MASSDGSIKMMFSNLAAKKKSPVENQVAKDDLSNFPDIDQLVSAGGQSAKNKKLSVERIYQKKTQHEHILLRPDTYIGSVEKTTQLMWVYDDLSEQMVQREITFVPGLYKIFDEILVNAADNKQRDPKGMNTIKIDIDPESKKIKIWNNGKGIPVVEHKTEKMYVPTMIFGHLLTSSNYDDTEKKVTGGRNGYGAKLCNIFSTKFVVETQSGEYKKSFRQTWSDNMTKASDPKILGVHGEDYTCITFYPDLSKFQMESLDKDIVDLFTRRAYDVVASTRGVKVFLNDKKLPIKNFKEYVELYTKDKVDENDQPLKIIHELINERWEVALTMSDKGFQQVSFVNSIATTKGGRHVDHVSEQIVANIIEVVKKKEKKGGVGIRPFQVKNHVWLFVNALIENPTFDSQTKENMTLQPKSFGSKCSLSEKFMNSASKCGIVEAIQSWMHFKAQTQLNKQCSGSKRSKLKGIPKLDDANDAGTKHSIDCTLILTEGDSAKTLAVAGLGVVGRDRYGVFPLKGKVLNVREATHKQIMENAEINNLIKIMGLQYKNKYETRDTLQTLRYGRLMIMTDQDQDGSHIKGLLINFIHHNWPNLLKHNFVEEFITPIVKVTKNKQEKAFYSLPEFEEWKSNTGNWHTWKVKYYKGLGTSTAKEAKEYFGDMLRHRIPFKYCGPEDDASIILAFSKKKIEERKEWLSNWMEEKKRRAQIGLAELYLYGKDTRSVTYNEFVNRELILYSNMDNERSLPSLVDGLKPGQRKVIFTCLKRNLTKELKVAQLAGSVAEISAYHHGEQSLMATIINLAQNFVGSNNLNLLQPIGQFGTRLSGGKDSASPRYIFTMLSTLARHVFNPHDDALLRHLRDDNTRIEPEWYMPILPMVLVNGAEGIGTGWSTKIPNYDIREIVNNLRLMLDGREPLPMLPSFKNFTGSIEALDDNRFVVNGEVSVIDDQTIEITELPIRVWTQNYKESVLEPMLQGTEKTPALITDYKEYHTDTTVKFIVKMSSENLRKSEATGLHNVFKLQVTLSTTSMVLFDGAGCIKRYANVEEIFREFYALRMEYYFKRKEYLEGMLTAESLKLNNQARFICEKIENLISIENKLKKELIKLLVQRGYDSDPVKAWKEVQDKLQAQEEAAENDSETENRESQSDESSKGPDFNYILNMQLWCLTKERKDELLKQRDAKAEELHLLRKKKPTDLWKDDLNNFITELDKVEKQEKEDDLVGSGNQGQAKGKGKPKKAFAYQTKPSPMGRRVLPSTEIMRSKVEAAKKKQKLKEEKKVEDDDLTDLLDGETKPLGERVGAVTDSGEKPAKVKKPRKTREKSASESPKKTGGGAKKGKKRNPWSDEDSDVSLASDESLDDKEISFTDSVEQREKGPRRAAASKVKYTFDDEESERADNSDDEIMRPLNSENFNHHHSEAESQDVDLSDSDDGFRAKPKSAPAAATERPNSKKLFTVIDSEDEGEYQPPEKKKPAKKSESEKSSGEKIKKVQPKKKAPAPPALSNKGDAVFILESDEDLQPAKKKPGPKRKATKVSDSDVDNSADEFIPTNSKTSRKATTSRSNDIAAKPKKAVSAKKKQKFPDSDDSGDDGFPMDSKKQAKDTYTGDGDLNDIADVPLRARLGRMKAPVKYNFGDSDDDDN